MNNLSSILRRNQSWQTLIAFAEHVGDGIAIIDLNGTVCFANTSWAKMHGYVTPGELIEKNLCLFHTPGQIKTVVLPLMEEVRQKGTLEVPLEHVRNDSSAFQTLTKIIVLNGTGGKNLGFIIFAKDVSEHKRFEQSSAKLKLANEHLQEQIAQMCESKQSLVQRIDKIKNKSDELHSEILDHSAAEEQNNEAIPIREIPPFDPKKLKALADLAKRLAKKSKVPAV
jgi:PAS domain S-box-containing protein